MTPTLHEMWEPAITLELAFAYNKHGKNFLFADETFIKSHKKQMLSQVVDSKVRLGSFLPCLLLLSVSGHPSK